MSTSLLFFLLLLGLFIQSEDRGSQEPAVSAQQISVVDKRTGRRTLDILGESGLDALFGTVRQNKDEPRWSAVGLRCCCQQKISDLGSELLCGIQDARVHKEVAVVRSMLEVARFPNERAKQHTAESWDRTDEPIQVVTVFLHLPLRPFLFIQGRTLALYPRCGVISSGSPSSSRGRGSCCSLWNLWGSGLAPPAFTLGWLGCPT